jgi:hypothetical protein
MTAIQGKVKSVYIVVVGADLEADAIIGQTVLELSNVDDFDEEGGQIQIEGSDPLTFVSIATSDGVGLDAENEENPPVYTMTLEDPLLVGYPEGSRVSSYPYGEEKMAIVMIPSLRDVRHAR